MADQVEKLKSLDIKAAAIHSGVGKHEMQVLLENALQGAYKILYISPERLENLDFKTRLSFMQLSFIAVDEAHCISQWGYDFRPSYLTIRSVREIKPGIPILALTATATPKVVEDIQIKLGFKEHNVIKTNFDRQNLVYFVKHSESKLSDLIKTVHSIRGSGIIYARSRKKTREISEHLKREKISADYYHAGLSFDIRLQKQNDWTKGKTRVIVATNAFGMGIDKPDVRFVIHIDFPDSLEEYFQEAGRAGRDNKKSFAVLLSGSRDKQLLNKRITDSFPEIDFVKKVYNACCNYLKVPVGGGKGIAFDFNFESFVTAYKFNAVQSFNALKLIEQQGYIELTDESQNPSRIYFIVNRDDLYRFQVKNSQFDGFIKLVLRSYTGLFSEYTAINEELLAKRAGLTRDMVYQYFVRLSKMNVIKYIPGKKTALLIFTEERLSERSLYISPENYQHRKERFVNQLEAIINYAFSENICRSVLLLNYFGQFEVEECGTCDYCRKRNKHIDESKVKEIELFIKEKLSVSECFPEVIYSSSKFDRQTLSLVLKNMLNDESIFYTDDGKLQLTNSASGEN